MTLRTDSRKEVFSDLAGVRQYAIDPRSKSCGQTRLNSPSARFGPRRRDEVVEALDREASERRPSGLDHRLFEQQRIRESSSRDERRER